METFLIHMGYAALILFGFLEACCIPMSSEVTFGFAGVLAGEGHLNLALVIVIGTLAELAGSYVSYTVGRVAERPVVERFGRYLLITKSDIDRTEHFLSERGAWAIPLGRALPVVRAFTSVGAGFARVPALRFGILSLIGTVIYATLISSIGYALGSAWQRIAGDLSLAGYLIAILVVAIIAIFIIYRLHAMRHETKN
ncbi:MAG: DedA family protein [Streptosporangiaceae bacterium]